MADSKEKLDNSIKDRASDKPKQVNYSVIKVSVPEIISALHQKAITNVKVAEVRIANSAIEGDGKTAKLNSAGQHIISVLSKKEGEIVEKSDGIAALKQYVSAFVGPDLADKVTEKTVLKLGSDDNAKQSDENKPEKEKKEKENKQEKTEDKKRESNDKSSEQKSDNKEEKDSKQETLNSSVEPVIKSFQRFLVEDCGMKFLLEEGEKEKSPDSSNDKKDKKSSEDEGAIGWYVAYNLKVEGLKESNLKDSMKDFALSFFDNLKITASGLFGGSQELTGKKIRKSFHDLMHVNYEKLKDNFSKLLKRDYPIASKDADIDVKDPKSLLRSLSKTKLSKDEKSAILSANYSLTVKYKEEDPSSPILNKKRVADLIRKSIQGFRFGTKLNTTADAVIKIENFEDHVNSREAKAEIAKLPSAIVITKLLSKDNFKLADALSVVAKQFKTAEKNKKSLEQEEVRTAIDLWKAYYNKLNQIQKSIENAKDPKKSELTNQAKKLFQKFRDEYEKTIQDIEGTKYISSDDLGSFGENLKTRRAYATLIEKRHVLDCIMQMLFEDYSAQTVDPIEVFGRGLNEAETPNITTIEALVKKSFEAIVNHKIKYKVAKADEVKKWISDEVAIDASSIFDKIQDKKYAAAFFVKLPKKFKNSKTGKTITKAPSGNKIKKDVAEKTFKDEIFKDIDFDLYVETGTSEKHVYQDTKVPAKVRLFVAAFDLKDDNSKDAQNPSETSAENNSQSLNVDIEQSGVDLYIYPIASAKDFNDAGDLE